MAAMWGYPDIQERLQQHEEHHHHQYGGQRVEAVVEEAFEVQAYQPFHGWTFERFCDRSGNTFPALSAAAAAVASETATTEDRLNMLGDHMEGMEIGGLPSSAWMWSHPWLRDSQYTRCDDEGWSYGSTIARINRRLAEGKSKARREYYHFVRRRRWIRTRIKKPIAVDDEQDDESDTMTYGVARKSSDRDDHSYSVALAPNASPPTRYYRTYRGSLMAHFRFGQTANLSNFIKSVFTEDDVQREGWLVQRGTFSRSWKLRYFILRRDTSSLVCLRDCASLVMINEVPIDRHTSLLVEESPNQNLEQFQFLVINGEHRLRLNAVDAECRSAWLSALSELIVRKRTSFLAAEDSDSVQGGMGGGSFSGSNSVRGSRMLRRLRSSFAGGGGEESFNTWTTFDTVGSQRELEDAERLKKKVWRPYTMVASTMRDTSLVDQSARLEYLVTFQAKFTTLIEVTREFFEENLEILEENLRTAEHLLTSAVAKVPKEEISSLRGEVQQCIASLTSRLQSLVQSDRANVLQCNMMRKLLYTEAKRVNDMILSFTPPVAQLTVKKVAAESQTKRQIPTDWFTEPTEEEKVKSLQAASDTVVDYSRQSFPAAQTGSLFNKADQAVIALGLRRKRHSDASALDSTSSAVSSTLTSQSTALVSTTETIKIKTYLPLPSEICEGHMELRSGLNGYVMLVHERDLGSLIGFTLCSRGYVSAVESHFAHSLKLSQELLAEEYAMADRRSSTSGEKAPAPGLSSPTELLYLNKLRSNDVQHTEVKFAYENKTIKHDFRCVTFFASQFHALRALAGPGNADYMCSIAESKSWEATGGKSGAYFSMTHDRRYILKGIPVTEFNMFLHMAPHYFKFMSRLVKSQNPTLITKILGLYKLTHSRRMHKQTFYVVVMEHIGYGCPPGQIYDLKGITRRRYSVDSSSDGERGSFSSDDDRTCRQTPESRPVLLDGNLMERIPIPVRQADLGVIETAIQNDTSFLSRAGVIDYSLLLLFDEEKRQVVVGLIDYLHQFDFLKKMESTSKASLTFRNPTIISPISYRRRFVDAMHRYLVGIELELELRIRKRAQTTLSKRNRRAGLLANGDDSNSGRAHPLSQSASVRTGRSVSEAGIISRNAVFDRDAAQAHSDGEEFSSVESDEMCSREACSFVSSVLSMDADR